jgi:hypothetical protein
MADRVLEMESNRGDVEGVGFEVSMQPVDVGEVDASNDGEEAKGDECKNLVGFQWGWGFSGLVQSTTKCKNWVFWVVSLDDARKKSTEREMRVSGVGDIVF